MICLPLSFGCPSNVVQSALNGSIVQCMQVRSKSSTTVPTRILICEIALTIQGSSKGARPASQCLFNLSFLLIFISTQVFGSNNLFIPFHKEKEGRKWRGKLKKKNESEVEVHRASSTSFESTEWEMVVVSWINHGQDEFISVCGWRRKEEEKQLKSHKKVMLSPN